jgi:hypothetical protein
MLMLRFAREQEAIFGIFCRDDELANDVFGAKNQPTKAIDPQDRRAIDSNAMRGIMMEASRVLYVYICFKMCE